MSLPLALVVTLLMLPHVAPIHGISQMHFDNLQIPLRLHSRSVLQPDSGNVFPAAPSSLLIRSIAVNGASTPEIAGVGAGGGDGGGGDGNGGDGGGDGPEDGLSSIIRHPCGATLSEIDATCSPSSPVLFHTSFTRNAVVAAISPGSKCQSNVTTRSVVLSMLTSTSKSPMCIKRRPRRNYSN